MPPNDPKRPRSRPKPPRGDGRPAPELRDHPAGPRGSAGEVTEPRQWAHKLRLDYYERLDTTLYSTTKDRRFVNGGANCEPGLWTVSVQARELVGVVSVGQELPREALILSGRAAKHSELQVVLTWSLGMAQDNEETLDVGSSFVYSFFGMTPKLSVRLPSGALIDQAPPTVVPPQPDTPNVLPYINSVLMGAINRAQVWNARSIYQSTFTRAVPANEFGAIPVPLGTQFVEMFQRGSDPVAVPAYDYFTAGGQEIAELGVEVGQRRTGAHRVPGNCAVIRSRAIANAALITGIFQLEQ